MLQHIKPNVRIIVKFLDLIYQITIFGKKINNLGFQKPNSICNLNADVMNEAFSKLHADDSGNSFQLNSELFYNGIKLSFDSFSESQVHNALFSIKSSAVGYIST